MKLCAAVGCNVPVLVEEPSLKMCQQCRLLHYVRMPSLWTRLASTGPHSTRAIAGRCPLEAAMSALLACSRVEKAVRLCQVLVVALCTCGTGSASIQALKATSGTRLARAWQHVVFALCFILVAATGTSITMNFRLMLLVVSRCTFYTGSRVLQS